MKTIGEIFTETKADYIIIALLTSSPPKAKSLFYQNYIKRFCLVNQVLYLRLKALLFTKANHLDY